MKLLASQWAGSWEVYHRKRLHLTSKIIKRKCHCLTNNDFSLNIKNCKLNQNDYIGHLFIKFANLLVRSSQMLVWSTADLMNSIGEKNLPWGLPGVRSLENLYAASTEHSKMYLAISQKIIIQENIFIEHFVVIVSSLFTKFFIKAKYCLSCYSLIFLKQQLNVSFWNASWTMEIFNLIQSY